MQPQTELTHWLPFFLLELTNSNLIGHWKSHVITLINVSKYYYLIHKESCLANPLTTTISGVII